MAHSASAGSVGAVFKPVAVELSCDHALMRGRSQTTRCEAARSEVLKQCGQSPNSRQRRDVDPVKTDIVRFSTEDINLTKRARQPASERKSLNYKLGAARDNVRLANSLANKRTADIEVQVTEQSHDTPRPSLPSPRRSHSAAGTRHFSPGFSARWSDS